MQYKRLLKMNLPKKQSAFLWGARKTGKSTFLKENFPFSSITFITRDLIDVLNSMSFDYWLKHRAGAEVEAHEFLGLMAILARASDLGRMCLLSVFACIDSSNTLNVHCFAALQSVNETLWVLAWYFDKLCCHCFVWWVRAVYPNRLPLSSLP